MTQTTSTTAQPASAVQLPATMDEQTFSERAHRFHRAVYASEPFVFDQVMRRFFTPEAGHVAQDHCLVHDGADWHLFVLSAPLEEAEPLIQAVRARDWDKAARHPYAVGEVHAAGPSLFDLRPVGRILERPQGRFSMLCQGTSFVYPYRGGWIDLYTASGPEGQGLCLARSADLSHWEPDPRNPFWRPPAWAGGTQVCKAPYIVEHAGRYLIYYNLNLAEGAGTVALISTKDFEHFEDHGAVVKVPFQFRGTQGCESPCVLLRDGMWHLFFGSGEGWWHAISNRPDRFMSTQGISSATVQGTYLMGPFHACKIVASGDRWLMSSTYKEEHRRRCRAAGKRIFRGDAADEAGLCEGLFLTEIVWDGDRPVLQVPQDGRQRKGD